MQLQVIFLERRAKDLQISSNFVRAGYTGAKSRSDYTHSKPDIQFMQRKRPRSESPDAQCSTPVHGSGELVFDPNYHVNRSRALTSLWESDELCDIDVIVDTFRFPAHRSSIVINLN